MHCLITYSAGDEKILKICEITA